MIKILFVCHGNICRSPMAEFIFRDLVNKHGLSAEFVVASAATSMEEIGNPVYPPAKRKLAEYGIRAEGHHARRMERRDYQEYDYLIGMEQYNIRNMMRILGDDPQGKVSRLLDHAKRPRDIDDPWYSGDFETTYKDILEGCEALLQEILNTRVGKER
ncbi:MAG: low molecular weight phosphotyrosine protein phosphatase [Lachnospiraceae bacterium]|jgi:protein-tyrosine phosphatase|nr:low molecular weight phosphotyrosine protein phosphatase [Lachnospiraceae bacterium]RKJ51850.1 low molecular weight phosphotyrosine protein phosphatase [bacterium 1XD42-54]